MKSILVFARFFLILLITGLLHSCGKDDQEIINNSNNNNNNNPKDFREKYLGDYYCRTISKSLNDSMTRFIYYYSVDSIRFIKGEKDSEIYCFTRNYSHKIYFKFRNDTFFVGDHYGGWFYKQDSVYLRHTPLGPYGITHYGKKIIH